LNPDKCQLFWKEVRYLGHTVSPSGVTKDPEKLEAVKSWPRPNDRHQLRSFLGLCTYERRFIAGFADIPKLLIRLSEGKWTFEWSPEAETALHSLRHCVRQLSWASRDQERSSSLTLTASTWGLVEYCPKYQTEANGLLIV
jgi:hypothetical protein